MRLYAIKRPGCNMPMAFSYDQTRSWARFFEVEGRVSRLPLEEAIRAYESIGYQCVALECNEIVLDGC